MWAYTTNKLDFSGASVVKKEVTPSVITEEEWHDKSEPEHSHFKLGLPQVLRVRLDHHSNKPIKKDL